MIISGERACVEAFDMAAYKRFCRRIGVRENVLRNLHIRIVPTIGPSLLDLSMPGSTTRGQCNRQRCQIDIATAWIENDYMTEVQRVIVHETLHLTESNVLSLLWVTLWRAVLLPVSAALMVCSLWLFKHGPTRVRILPGATVSLALVIWLLRYIYLFNPNERRARKSVVLTEPLLKGASL